MKTDLEKILTIQKEIQKEFEKTSEYVDKIIETSKKVNKLFLEYQKSMKVDLENLEIFDSESIESMMYPFVSK